MDISHKNISAKNFSPRGILILYTSKQYFVCLIDNLRFGSKTLQTAQKFKSCNFELSQYFKSWTISNSDTLPEKIRSQNTHTHPNLMIFIAVESTQMIFFGFSLSTAPPQILLVDYYSFLEKRSLTEVQFPMIILETKLVLVLDASDSESTTYQNLVGISDPIIKFQHSNILTYHAHISCKSL